MRLNKAAHTLAACVVATIAVVTCSAVQSAGVTEAVEALPDPATPQNTKKLEACRSNFRIVLDVGHSKKTSGAMSARGKTEYEFNLQLVKTIRTALVKQGYSKISVLVSRGGPGSLDHRAEQANKLAADLFLSIHHDSVQNEYLEWWTVDGKKRQYSDRFRGFSLFVSKLNQRWEQSFRFASILGDDLLKRALTSSLHHEEDIPGERRPLLDRDRGIYQFDDLVVLKLAKVPAVLLEAGVIVNRDEERELRTAKRRNLIADSVVEAVDAFCAEGKAATESR
jgi:N-acetylmuramoyl-L-alanine amidase